MATRPFRVATTGAIGVLFALVTVPANNAAANDPPPKPEPPLVAPLAEEELQSRSPAFTVADEIKLKAEYEENGFAGLLVDAVNDEVDLWWKGQVDEDVQQVVSGAEASGVTVTVHLAERSRAQMRRLAERFHKSEAMRRAGLRVNGVTAPPDQSGFDITFSPSAIRDEAAASAQAKQVNKQVTGVPIRSAREEPDTVPARQNDSAPWWGGGAMRRLDGNGFCTTGFAVTMTSGDDRARMLSAAHCTLPGALQAWFDGDFDTLALATDTAILRTQDSLLLNPVGSTAGYIFTAGQRETDARGVAGSPSNNIGDRVRTSGANSGTHGPLDIVNDNYDRPCEGHEQDWCSDGIIASNPNGTIAVAQGDSGGPIWTHVNGSDTRIHAHGIIAGLQREIPCPGGLVDPRDAACGSRVIYQPIRAVINSWGNMTLKTVSQ